MSKLKIESIVVSQEIPTHGMAHKHTGGPSCWSDCGSGTALFMVNPEDWSCQGKIANSAVAIVDKDEWEKHCYNVGQEVRKMFKDGDSIATKVKTINE